MTKFLTTLLYAGLLVLVPASAWSADFYVTPDQTLSNGRTLRTYVSIVGEIKQGDYDRFKEFLLEPDNLVGFLTMVNLASPGGNVVEGMKFANLFDRAFVKVGVSEQCYSSCFIMFAGGVDRTLIGVGELGVHRISIRELQLDIQKAKAQISPLAADVSAFLLQQGIPRALVDKMNETPASDIFRVDHYSLSESAFATGVFYSPVFIDTVDKACGRNPDPYPGKYVREAPRGAETLAAIADWVRCSNKVRLRNAYKFLFDELALLKAGKPSIAFPSGTYQLARKSVGD